MLREILIPGRRNHETAMGSRGRDPPRAGTHIDPQTIDVGCQLQVAVGDPLERVARARSQRSELHAEGAAFPPATAPQLWSAKHGDR